MSQEFIENPAQENFRHLKTEILLSSVNDGVFDPARGKLGQTEIKTTPESGNIWLAGEIAIPKTDASPTVIIGSNTNSDLRLGFGLRTVSDVVEEGVDRARALSFAAMKANLLDELSKASGITHVIERDDESLPNSALQISLPRRGAIVVAYGREIDIVAKQIHENELPETVETPLQGRVDDYQGEDKKYDNLHPVVMWRDEPASMMLKDELDWRTSGKESAILPQNDTLVIFNSADKRYAIKILQRPNISKTPYHWVRILTYRTYPLDTADSAIFDDLFPEENAE